jgi:hypothetical protein
LFVLNSTSKYYFRAREKFITIFKNVLSTIDKLEDYFDSIISDKIVLSMICLINTSSLFALEQKNEVFIKNQTIFLEIIVDFLLNIKEISSLLNKYNYDDKICSIEFLRLFSKALKNTNLLDYLIINISVSCLKFKISNYLTDFIRNCFTKITNKQIFDSIDGFIYANYINNLIKSTKEFDSDLNIEINNLLNNFQNLYLKLKLNVDSKVISNYFLIGLTQTLCCLYNEESAFYDEKNVLRTTLDDLKNAVDENEFICRICLTCLAYKSNLIDNIEVKNVYDDLVKVLADSLRCSARSN